MGQSSNSSLEEQIKNCTPENLKALVEESYRQKIKKPLPVGSAISYLKKEACPYCTSKSLFKVEPIDSDMKYKLCLSLHCSFNDGIHKVDD